jgi:hypothetical protein
MIVTDAYPGKDLGTLELTITVFWSCREPGRPKDPGHVQLYISLRDYAFRPLEHLIFRLLFSRA